MLSHDERPAMAVEARNAATQRRFNLWGGVMVGICFITGIIAYGGGRYSFGVFMKPMTEALGWTRTEMSLGATINLVTYAVASPFIGRMIEVGWNKWTPKSDRIKRRRCQIERDSTRKVHEGVSRGSGEAGNRGEAVAA